MWSPSLTQITKTCNQKFQYIVGKFPIHNKLAASACLIIYVWHIQKSNTVNSTESINCERVNCYVNNLTKPLWKSINCAWVISKERNPINSIVLKFKSLLSKMLLATGFVSLLYLEFTAICHKKKKKTVATKSTWLSLTGFFQLIIL